MQASALAAALAAATETERICSVSRLGDRRGDLPGRRCRNGFRNRFSGCRDLSFHQAVIPGMPPNTQRIATAAREPEVYLPRDSEMAAAAIAKLDTRRRKEKAVEPA